MFGGVQLAPLTVSGKEPVQDGEHNATVTFTVVREAAHGSPLVQTAVIIHRCL